MNVNFFVSTMNGETNGISHVLKDVAYINQGEKVEGFLNISSKGLSMSRNYGLNKATNDSIVVLTDNDVSFREGVEEILIRSFKKNPEADIITFQVLDLDGKKFKNNYRNKRFYHNKFSIMKVSSIEIAIKKSSKIPMFDERFGLGGEVPIGEENIFLSDALDANCKILYLPIVIGKHNDIEHSGTFFTKDIMLQRKIIFKRIYGNFLGKGIFLLYKLKNIKRILK